mmetsp:Transcript_17719/g.44258  ORF Transcript_17719/g.44258 Transcript_17719/m.44258 type:complete len:210 (-) Transcript_17719:2116-2745(-)
MYMQPLPGFLLRSNIAGNFGSPGVAVARSVHARALPPHPQRPASGNEDARAVAPQPLVLVRRWWDRTHTLLLPRLPRQPLPLHHPQRRPPPLLLLRTRIPPPACSGGRVSERLQADLSSGGTLFERNGDRLRSTTRQKQRSPVTCVRLRPPLLLGRVSFQRFPVGNQRQIVPRPELRRAPASPTGSRSSDCPRPRLARSGRAVRPLPAP